MLAGFAAELDELLLDLALQVIRDGEGASKLVRIDVTGATTARSAKRIAMAVANSPLVKTAIAGEDANWGRIVMAVGKAGEPADRDRLSVAVGGVWMAKRRRRGAGVRRDAGGRTHEGARDRDRDRSGSGAGEGHRVDLRSDARVYRHQWVVSKLSGGGKRGGTDRPRARARCTRPRLPRVLAASAWSRQSGLRLSPPWVIAALAARVRPRAVEIADGVRHPA